MKLASLERAEAALAFSSGMGAAAALFLAHGRNGIVCVGEAYGGTLELLADQLPQLGIRTALDAQAIAEAMERHPRIVAGNNARTSTRPDRPSALETS